MSRRARRPSRACSAESAPRPRPGRQPPASAEAAAPAARPGHPSSFAIGRLRRRAADGGIPRRRPPGDHGHPRHHVLKAGEEANGYLNAANRDRGLIGGVIARALVLRRRLGRRRSWAGAIITGLGTIALRCGDDPPIALIAIGVLASGALIITSSGRRSSSAWSPTAPRPRDRGPRRDHDDHRIRRRVPHAVFLTSFGPFASLGAAGVATIAITRRGAGDDRHGGRSGRRPPYEARSPA